MIAGCSRYGSGRIVVGLLCAAIGIDASATTRAFPGAAPCDTTMQACIDGSTSGDTIDLATGIYIEPEIVVDKSLTLNGTGSGLVTLQPNAAHRVLAIGPDISAGVKVSNLKVTGGSCVGDEAGGGIFVAAGTPLTLTSVDVSGNACAGASGGGIFATGDVVLTGVNVIGNTTAAGAGGGMVVLGSATIDGGRLENNTSFYSGGGLRVEGTLTMTDVDVINNANSDPGSGGGGVYAAGDVVVTGGTFKDNHAGGSGGGLFSSTATISGTTFQHNTGQAGGGAVLQFTSTIVDALFDSNIATDGNGGAIWSSGLLTVSKTTLTGNQAIGDGSNGSGIPSDGGGIFSGSTVLADVVLIGNTAAGSGGGASIGNALITRSIFQGNTAVNEGGGVRLLTETDIRNSIFRGNQATVGGAVAARFSGGPSKQLNVLGSLFFDNTVTSGGTGLDIAVFDLDLSLINETFARPGGSGASIAISSSAVGAYNCIFSGYASSLSVSDPMDTAITEDYNDFFNSPYAAQTIAGGHSLTSDPKFLDPGTGNFRVSISSPAIDAGINSAVPVDLTTDLAGLPRRLDVATVPDSGNGIAPIVDIGAFEFGDTIFADGFD